MIDHELFEKDTIIHAIIKSTTYPTVSIPVKAYIKDVVYDEENPMYIAKILKFYDDADFLKKYFFDCQFKSSYSKKRNRFENERPPLVKDDTKNVQSILDKINSKNFTIGIDSVLAKKTKAEILDLYNKLEDYFIAKTLVEWRRRSTRSSYKGIFSIDGKNEWKARFNNGFYDKIEQQSNDPEGVIRDIFEETPLRNLQKIERDAK